MKIVSIAFSLVCLLLNAGSPVVAKDFADTCVGGRIAESHILAAENLIVASNQGEMYEVWGEQFVDQLAAIFDNPATGTAQADYVRAISELGDQSIAKLRRSAAILYACELSETNLTQVAEMYSDGKTEKKIFRTRPGKAWRKAILSTVDARAASVDVMKEELIGQAMQLYDQVLGSE